MKTITIDFTKSPVEVSDRILGYQGEKNATELVITPPAEMSENADVVSYSVAFQIGAYKVHHSAICKKAETITVPIEKKVSKTNVVSLQLEGYDAEEKVLVKSERIDNLIFDMSVVGEEDESNEKSELIEQIAKLKEEITSGPPYKTVSLTNGTNCTAYSNLISGVSITLSEEIIPIGSEIKAIRFNYQGQWIDIRDMAAIDDYPYILNMHKVVYSQVIGELVLAIVSFVSETNTVITALQNIEIEEIEVDYYTNL